MKGARGVLINITGGMDMTLFEVDEAANRIRDEVDPDANIIFGSTFDQALDGKIRISVVATGIESIAQIQPRGNAALAAVSSIVARNPNPQPGTLAGGYAAEPRMDAMATSPLTGAAGQRSSRDGFGPACRDDEPPAVGSHRDDDPDHGFGRPPSAAGASDL